MLSLHHFLQFLAEEDVAQFVQGVFLWGILHDVLHSGHVFYELVLQFAGREQVGLPKQDGFVKDMDVGMAVGGDIHIVCQLNKSLEIGTHDAPHHYRVYAYEVRPVLTELSLQFVLSAIAHVGLFYHHVCQCDT